MIQYRIILLSIIIFKRIITSNGITTRLEHPSNKSFRRHIGSLSTNDWEPGLREATYQALLRENNREPTLRDQIYYAPLEGRQDAAIPFGDIIVLAKGQLYSTYNGFKFVQDPYQNDCDDCHNGRIRCTPSQCKGWNPVTGEQLVALWTVKRIRHRDPVYGHRYELEYTVSPISAVVNSGFLSSDGGFDYNVPGHVFIIKTDPNTDKTTSHKSTTVTFDQGTTWFNTNYVSLDGSKEHSYRPGNPSQSGYKPVFPHAGEQTKPPTSSGPTGSAQEVELYKELINSLAMKTSTSLKPSATSPHYSEIFDATIQKVPVTMIHQQATTIPLQKTTTASAMHANTVQTTQTQITSIWTTPLDANGQVQDTTKPIKFPTNTRYSQPDPLYHSTTAKNPPINVQQTSKIPITTITFFAPDDSVTENEIFEPPDTQTAKYNTVQTPTSSATVANLHSDIFDEISEESTTGADTTNIIHSSASTNVQTQSTSKPSTTTEPEQTTFVTTRPTTATRTRIPTTTTRTTTLAYGRKTTSARKPTRRTRKPFVPNRFTKTTSTTRTTQKPQTRTTTKRRTTTPSEFDEVFFHKITTTPQSTTQTTQIVKNTTPSIFDVSLEESEESEGNVSPTENKEISTMISIVDSSGSTLKPTSEGADGTTERKVASTQDGESEEDENETATFSVTRRTTTKPFKAIVKTTESSLTTPYTEKLTTTTPLSERTSFADITRPTITERQTRPSTDRRTTTDKTTIASSTEPDKTTSTFEKTESTISDLTTEEPIFTSTFPTTQTKPVVFVGTIITKRPSLTKTQKTTAASKRKRKPTKDSGGHKDIYDIFGEDAPSVLEKPVTEKHFHASAVADDFLFGSEISHLPATTQGALVIFDNFFQASTTVKTAPEKYTTTPYSTQLQNSSAEIKTEAEPSTSMSYITSISFEVNSKNKTKANSSRAEHMIKATVKEITTNANDFKVFKAEMPDSKNSSAMDTKQQFDHIALSLINHARTIDILNSNKTRIAKHRRRSYSPRRGRKRKIQREREKM